MDVGAAEDPRYGTNRNDAADAGNVAYDVMDEDGIEISNNYDEGLREDVLTRLEDAEF